MIPESAHCPKCGARLAPGLLGDACPNCVLQAAFQFRAPEPSASEPPTPKRFGDYELLEEIARGGMGVVYKARQVSLDRLVAVKILLFGPHATPEMVKRFRVEASAAAALQHPNIVAIHEVGVHENQHYLVMDLVDGPNLACVAKNQPLAGRRAATYLKTIAEAIHYAHERGILHRDLKPSNVIIDSHDQARVTDFGLARRLDSASSLTLSGEVLGSPNYMPPEQACGCCVEDRVSRGSDVYGLGAILYHLLTGRAPFQSESVPHTLHLVLNQEPVAPRLLNPGASVDLQTICLKCLEKQPHRRYATAQELAQELDCVLRDEPIRARPISPPEKAWRWCRRKPLIASLTSVIALMLLSGVIATILLSKAETRRERERREAAERVRQQAEHLSWEAELSAYAADVTAAYVLASDGDPGRARELLGRYLDPKWSALRGFEWGHLWLATTPMDSHASKPREGIVFALEVLANGTNYVRFDQAGFHTGELADLREIRHVSWPAQACCFAAFSANARNVAVGTDDGGLWLEFPSGAVLQRLVGKEMVANPAFWPDGSTLATASADAVALWQVGSDQPSHVFTNGHGWVAVSPFGDTIVTADGSHRGLLVLSAGDLKQLAFLEFDLGPSWTRPQPLAFSADGKFFAAGNANGLLSVWRMSAAPVKIVQLENHPGVPLRCVRFSPDGTWLASGGSDKSIRLVSTKEWTVSFVLQGHDMSVTSLAFTGDSLGLLSGDEDGTVRRWSFNAQRATQIVKMPHPWWLSADGRSLVRPSGDRDYFRFQLLEIASSNILAEVALPRRYVRLWDLSRDGRWLAVVTPGNELQLWNMHSGQQQAKASIGFEVHSRHLFSIDNRRAFAAGPEGVVRVWDLPDLRPLPTVTNATEVTHMVADVLIGRADKDSARTVALYDLRGSGLIAHLTGHSNDVETVDTSWDGRYLATPSFDGTVRVWNLADGSLRHVLPAQRAGNNIVQFSPSGQTLATAGVDGTVTLWSLCNGRKFVTLKGPPGPLAELLFSKDGKTLAAYGRDHQLKIWRAADY